MYQNQFFGCCIKNTEESEGQIEKFNIQRLINLYRIQEGSKYDKWRSYYKEANFIHGEDS